MSSRDLSPPRTRKAVRKAVLRNEMSSWLHRRGKSMPVEDLTEDQQNDIRECFDLFDADGSGALDMDEVMEACEVLGLDAPGMGGSGGGGGMIGRLVDAMESEGIDELDYPHFESVVCKTLGDIALIQARQQSSSQALVDESETDVLGGTRDRAMVFKRKQLMGNLLRGGHDLSEMVRDQEELLAEITTRFRRVIKTDGRRTSQEQVFELLHNLDPVAASVAPGITQHFKHLQNMADSKLKMTKTLAAVAMATVGATRRASKDGPGTEKPLRSAKHFVSDKRVIETGEAGVLSFRCGGDVIVSTPRSGNAPDPSPPTPLDSRQALVKQRTQRAEIKLHLEDLQEGDGDGEEGAEGEKAGGQGDAPHGGAQPGTRTAHVHLSGEGERRGTGKGASAAAESAAADADEATGFIDRHTARLSVSTAAGEVARQPQDSAAPLALPWSGVPASMQSRAPVKQTPRNKRVAKELPTVNYSAPLSTLLAGPIRLATPPIRASKSLPAGVPRLPLDKLARDDSSPRPHRQIGRLHMTAFANSKIESLFSEIFLSGPEVSSTF
eukprot:jgi/Tetstr1/455989/TSEL_042767.t1